MKEESCRDDSLTPLHFRNVDLLICVTFAFPGPQHSQENRGLQKGRGSQEEAPRVRTVLQDRALGLNVANIYFHLRFLISVRLNRLCCVRGY